MYLHLVLSSASVQLVTCRINWLSFLNPTLIHILLLIDFMFVLQFVDAQTRECWTFSVLTKSWRGKAWLMNRTRLGGWSTLWCWLIMLISWPVAGPSCLLLRATMKPMQLPSSLQSSPLSGRVILSLYAIYHVHSSISTMDELNCGCEHSYCNTICSVVALNRVETMFSRSFTESRYEAVIRLASYRALAKYGTLHLGYDEDPATVGMFVYCPFKIRQFPCKFSF